MTEKYIDLACEITRMHDSADLREGVYRALNWLDEHRGQTPGPTITESQLKTMASQLFYRWSDLATMTDKLADELNEVGVTVTPVPEPTLLPNTPGATVKMRKHHQWVRTTTGAWISTDGSVLDQDGAQEIADEHGFAIIHDGVTSDHDRAWWIENANVNDAEDCEACVGDLCPVHHGMAVGIELMARKIAALGADPEMFALIPDPPKAKEGAQK